MADCHESQARSHASDEQARARWRSSTSLHREIADLRRGLSEADARATHQSVLLREADHRIKNSLQIVAGLTRSAARRTQDLSPTILLGVAERIQEVAHLHDLLQLTPDSVAVDLGDMLHRMRRSFATIVADDTRRIQVQLDAGPISVPASFARSVMMMASELVLNAVLHAFPDNRTGCVRIEASSTDGVLCVSVADDGVGLPPAASNGSGFGMKLVRAMASQVGGELVAARNGDTSGARFILTARHADA